MFSNAKQDLHTFTAPQRNRKWNVKRTLGASNKIISCAENCEAIEWKKIDGKDIDRAHYDGTHVLDFDQFMWFPFKRHVRDKRVWRRWRLCEPCVCVSAHCDRKSARESSHVQLRIESTRRRLFCLSTCRNRCYRNRFWMKRASDETSRANQHTFSPPSLQNARSRIRDTGAHPYTQQLVWSRRQLLESSIQDSVDVPMQRLNTMLYLRCAQHACSMRTPSPTTDSIGYLQTYVENARGAACDIHLSCAIFWIFSVFGCVRWKWNSYGRFSASATTHRLRRRRTCHKFF